MFDNLKKLVAENRENKKTKKTTKKSRKQKIVEETYDPTPNNYKPKPAGFQLAKSSLERDAIKHSIKCLTATSQLMEYKVWLESMLAYISREKGNAVTSRKRDELIGAEKFVEAALFKFGQECELAMKTIYSTESIKPGMSDPGELVNSRCAIKDALR